MKENPFPRNIGGKIKVSARPKPLIGEQIKVEKNASNLGSFLNEETLRKYLAGWENWEKLEDKKYLKVRLNVVFIPSGITRNGEVLFFAKSLRKSR
jgi:hypothetical protein